ncbi:MULTISPECIES: rRNA maturation RNase YbeY [Bartonella]|uniref:rRNA maturation RNase YbeY n=1 Tax=Bartonella TaxID=773 RepID=UPI0018DC214C|nr:MULTISPECIES: rRNA maturation RNase YbeY [Bartonella]MBH9974577.1 rRNA maturation RNase YbeY [Bartonella choladocola]MBI0014184.1 rRNA maturation RNase YbeY [Bartonella sp. B10834G3]
MTVRFDVAINAEGWQNEEALRRIVDPLLQATLVELGFGKIESELSLVFTDDKDIRAINGQWRHIDKPTNVLSFPAFPVKPGQQPGPILGDIVLAFETVEREAREENKSFDDHLGHLIVHGLLHLMGYDHQTDEEAEQMEGLEIKILSQIGISNPYSE